MQIRSFEIWKFPTIFWICEEFAFKTHYRLVGLFFRHMLSFIYLKANTHQIIMIHELPLMTWIKIDVFFLNSSHILDNSPI